MELGHLRFVVDENTLVVGKIMQQLRDDVAYVGDPLISDLIPRQSLDKHWIPVVAEHGWVAITNDHHMRTRHYEASLALEHGLMVVNIKGVGHRTAWDLRNPYLHAAGTGAAAAPPHAGGVPEELQPWAAGLRSVGNDLRCTRCHTDAVSTVDVLNREMYSEAEAARLLRVAPSTLHYWLEGGERRGRTYLPILRVEATGTRSVTWAEFVEAAFLREYRRSHGVPMAELRGFIDRLREHYGVAYPLAHHQPFVSGRQLVYEAQAGSGLAPEFCLVAVVSGQYVLTPASDSYLKRVTWDDDVASAWRPHDDPASPVRVDPEVRFGRPAIHGISTEILWEQSQSGADAHELSEAFDLDVSDVQWALAYEHSHRAA